MLHISIICGFTVIIRTMEWIGGNSYLITALYNAPTTMDSYYELKVNHDLYGTE